MANKEKKNRAQVEKQVRANVGTEEKAFRIVEELALVDCVTETELEKMVNLVMPEHYIDVVEERSISKICGYPICNKKMEKVPKQKYHISTKTNKVYDISQRKCFCSNFCYKASKFLESQIPTSLLWAREVSVSLPKITFLEHDETDTENEGSRGLTGDPLFQALKLTEEAIENPINDETIPNSDELKDNLPSMEDTFGNDERFDSSKRDTESGNSIDSSNISTRIKKRVGTKVTRVPVSEQLDMITHLCNVLQEWCTVETRLLLSSRFSTTKCCNPGSSVRSKNNIAKQAQRFLNRDQSTDDVILQPECIEEVKEQDDVKREARMSDNDGKSKSDGVEIVTQMIGRNLKVEETDEERQQTKQCIIPLIDSRSQMTIRRQIVSQKLQSRFMELLPSFGLTSYDVSIEFNSLIRTFSFSSHNIVLKSKEWSVLSLVLLQILTKQSDNAQMSSKERHEAVNKILQKLDVPNEKFCKLETILLPDTEELTCSIVKNSKEYDNLEELD